MKKKKKKKVRILTLKSELSFDFFHFLNIFLGTPS